MKRRQLFRYSLRCSEADNYGEYMAELKEAKPKKVKILTRKMQAGLVLVFSVIMLIFLALAVRLGYIVYADGTRYEKIVLEKQVYESNEIPYKRGDITDRKGTVFATSEKLYNLVLEPKTLLQASETTQEAVLSALSTCYNLDLATLRGYLTDRPDSYYIVLLKDLTYEDKAAFTELTEAEDLYVVGVNFEEYYKRTYPQGTLASDVIGYAYSGNTADWGVEGYYCDELNGTNGREYGYYDSELNIDATVKEAVNGNNVVTTIDADAQRIVEKLVRAYLEEEGADNVGVIIMNPNNGEVLAMYSSDYYDLNNPRDLSLYYTE